MSSGGSRFGGLAPGGGHKSGLCLNCSRNLFCLVSILVPVGTPHFCCFFTSLDTLPTCQLYMSLLLLHPAWDQSLPLWAPRLTCFSHCSICSASQHWPLHILSWGAHIYLQIILEHERLYCSWIFLVLNIPFHIVVMCHQETSWLEVICRKTGYRPFCPPHVTRRSCVLHHLRLSPFYALYFPGPRRSVLNLNQFWFCRQSQGLVLSLSHILVYGWSPPARVNMGSSSILFLSGCWCGADNEEAPLEQSISVGVSQVRTPRQVCLPRRPTPVRYVA